MLRAIQRLAPASCSRRSLFAASSTRFLTTPQRLDYDAWNDQDLQHFQDVLGAEHVLRNRDDTDPFTIDWLQKYKPSESEREKSLVLKPRTTEQLSAILRHCNERKLAVVPQGGNTGLVGGSVPLHDEIVISTSLMNNIESFDPVSGVLVCEAGCILENLDSYLGKQEYMMPLDLGAKGTCQIGGNVSSNAGGLRLLRYGSLHGSVLGVEAVLADGTILDCLSTLRKDNTGYDLKQLFIGSEGTLGFVTKVSILTPPRPSSVNVALLGCESFEAVQSNYVTAKKHLGEVLSAVEFLDRPSLDMVLSRPEIGAKDPLDGSCPFYMLIETSGSNESHDMEKLEGYLETVMGSGDVVDGAVAQDFEQARKLFQLREDITLALSATGYVYKYDISLPMSQYYKVAEEMRTRLEPLGAQVFAYGHVGDCNVHLNILTPEYDQKVFDAIEPYVFEWTAERNGSISAEHGVGSHKPEYLHLAKSPSAIKLMHQMKRMMDPNNILNPYKVLPPENE